MTDAFTTIALILLTLLSLAAWWVALTRARRVARGGDANEGAGTQNALVVATVVLGGAAYIFRVVRHKWEPLESHVDGLLLIGVLLSATVFFLVRRAHIRGLSLFALPLLAVIFLWAICSSIWTNSKFGEIRSIWQWLHLVSVYGGMLFFAIAAVAGGMYLYVQRKLRVAHDPAATRPFASLEAIETLIVRTSAIGFALLTLGLITGMIFVTAGPTRLGDGWWHSPKVVLAGAVWLIYALVMNVRHTTHFRGARAAWLSIAGLVLLIATFGVTRTLPPLPSSTPLPFREGPGEGRVEQRYTISITPGSKGRRPETTQPRATPWVAGDGWIGSPEGAILVWFDARFCIALSGLESSSSVEPRALPWAELFEPFRLDAPPSATGDSRLGPPGSLALPRRALPSEPPRCAS